MRRVVNGAGAVALEGIRWRRVAFGGTDVGGEAFCAAEAQKEGNAESVGIR